MAKKFLKDVKTNNTAQVLECIFKGEQISRIEIAEKTGLSPSTVSQAVASLLEDGLVEEIRRGESTGGRKPVLLQIRSSFGCVVTVDIRRSGVEAQVFDLRGQLLSTQTLSGRKVSGNVLSDMIYSFIKEVQTGRKQVPDKIIGIGVLCQDDIPEYDLMTEYSTYLSTDVVRLETSLAVRCGIPVKKELTNRYNLNYYLKTIDANYVDYAYINLGERITASFMLGKKLVHNSNDSVFDISAAVLSGNYADGGYYLRRDLTFAQELALKKLTNERLAEKLVKVIQSALLFFPVSDIFIGGQIEGLENIVDEVAKAFVHHPIVQMAGKPGKHVNNAFACQILSENFKRLLNA